MDASSSQSNQRTSGFWSSLLQKTLRFNAREGKILLLASFYSFLVLFCYYLIRPFRDSIGTAKGLSEVTSWLFTAVFIAMIVLNPVYGYLVAHFSRKKFIPWVNHVFSISLVGFFFAFLLLKGRGWIYVARAFFVWAAIFNLSIVSVLWDFMTDVFSEDQGKRLFGFLFAAGSLGGIVGPLFAELLTQLLTPNYLLLLSALALQIAIVCVKKMNAHTKAAVSDLVTKESVPARAQLDTAQLDIAEQPPGKHTFSGLFALFRSPFLLGICGYMLFYSLGGTLLYLKQNQVVHDQLSSPVLSTVYFARTDLLTNLLASIAQAFVAGRMMKRFGLGKTLAVLPLFFILAIFFLWWSPAPRWSLLAWLHWTPQLLWLLILQVLFRAIEFSLAKPARKVLFTTVTRNEKYSAQSIIDTLLPRFGDAIAGWTKALLNHNKIEIVRAGFYAMPLWVLWAVVSAYLGKKFQQNHDSSRELRR